MSFSASKTNQPAPELLDLRGLAAYSSLSVKTLRRHLGGHGGIPFYQPGGKILVRLSDFEKWLAAHSPSAQQDQDVAKIIAEFRDEGR